MKQTIPMCYKGWSYTEARYDDENSNFAVLTIKTLW